MKNWVVVANAAQARVLEEVGPRPGDARDRVRYTAVATLVHPKSRIKGVDLASDRPGHVERSGHGLSRTAYVPRSDPRVHEQDLFARELAALLDQGVADGRCAGLVLMAANPFLGRLKSHLGAQSVKAVLRTLAVDGTHLGPDELAERLSRDHA